MVAPLESNRSCGRLLEGDFALSERGQVLVGKIFDKLFLFLYSLVIAALSVMLIVQASGAVDDWFDWIQADELENNLGLQIGIVATAVVLLLLSLRFIYISLRTGSGTPPSIDQRNDFGDIRISIETVENLTLKAAGKIKGLQDLKARVRVTDAGLDITVRSVVDGETSIPMLTEEAQRAVKTHIEEITGIPVSDVSVYVANIHRSQTFKSRVE